MKFERREIAHGKHVTARPVKEDLVLVDLDKGEYHSLDASGRRVWEALEIAVDLDDLVERLGESFHGDRTEIARDAEELIRRLLDLGLIVANPE